MQLFERLCTGIRHHTYLSRADWLWNRVRTPYNGLIDALAQNGLERVINGTDAIRISSAHRAVPETYEPEVWTQLMNDVRCGDIVVDVGSYIGLYSIAIA